MGSEEAQLFRMQSIQSVNSFLQIKNIFDVSNIDSKEINRIKKEIYFILNENAYVIKRGIEASMDYLRDLFCRRKREISEHMSREDPNIPNTTSTRISRSGIVFIEQRAVTTNFVDYRPFLIQSIDKWWIKNGTSLKGSLPPPLFFTNLDLQNGKGDRNEIFIRDRTLKRMRHVFEGKLL